MFWLSLVMSGAAFILASISLIYAVDVKDHINSMKAIQKAESEANRRLLEHVRDVLDRDEKIIDNTQKSLEHSQEVIRINGELRSVVNKILNKLDDYDDRINAISKENELLRDALYFDGHGMLGREAADDGK